MVRGLWLHLAMLKLLPYWNGLLLHKSSSVIVCGDTTHMQELLKHHPQVVLLRGISYTFSSLPWLTQKRRCLSGIDIPDSQPCGRIISRTMASAFAVRNSRRRDDTLHGIRRICVVDLFFSTSPTCICPCKAFKKYRPRSAE